MDSSILSTSSIKGHETMGKFAGKQIFSCSPNDFVSCFQGRKKHKKWKTTISDPTLIQTIQNWKKQSNKNQDFILKNNFDGSMIAIT